MHPPSCRLLAACLVCVAGCQLVLPKGNPGLRPDQDRALGIIWEQTYKRTDAAPQVLWVELGELSCTDPNSGKPGFHAPEGCREGLTVTPKEVRVAWTGDDRMSGTALAHELLHALLGREGVIDANHQTEGFRRLEDCGSDHGERCGLVDTANRALARSSL
jgi:hypothetical protein